MKRSQIIIVVLLILFVSWAAYSVFVRRQLPPTQPSVTDSGEIPYTITTPYGEVRVPGTAYIEAFDPATNSNIPAINVRSEARSAVAPACTLSDGDTVNVSDSTRADGSAWLYVTSGGCRGWVLSDFVTPDR